MFNDQKDKLCDHLEISNRANQFQTQVVRERGDPLLRRRELGPDHAQRVEAGELSRSFQSNQPTLNPIRDRSGRLDITHDVIGVQDERKTSRSQEIDVNSFCEEPSSSERTGRPVTGPILGKPVHETSVIQTRSSEDRMDFNVEQTHERTWRPVITHDVINVSDSSQTRSAHESETLMLEMKYFVRERKDPLLIMT